MKVESTTTQIGTNLETLDKQKSRAIEAKQLLNYVNEFNEFDPNTFRSQIVLPKKMKSDIFNSKHFKQLTECAKTMKQLSSIANELRIDTSSTKEKSEKTEKPGPSGPADANKPQATTQAASASAADDKSKEVIDANNVNNVHFFSHFLAPKTIKFTNFHKKRQSKT